MHTSEPDYGGRLPKQRLHFPQLARRFSGVLSSRDNATANFEATQSPCSACSNDLAKESKFPFGPIDAPTNRRASRTSNDDSIHKYWGQRFRLVSKFIPDLELTKQAWFSITPEEIAKHMMSRIASLSRALGRKIRVLDPMCGSGASAAQCALMEEVEQVFASDVLASEVSCTKRMAALYGVESKISFRVSDLDASMFGTQIDAVLLCPPWGGPAYQTGTNDIAAMDPGYEKLLEFCARFSRNIAVLMPRNLAFDQVPRTAAAASSVEGVEIETNFLGRKIKTASLYYGGLVNNNIRKASS